MQITTEISCHTAALIIEAARLKGHSVTVSLVVQDIIRQMGAPEADLFDIVWNVSNPFDTLMGIAYPMNATI